MAIKGERALKALGIIVELIPVPRQISSACGFCLSIGSVAIARQGMQTIREQTVQGRESLWYATEHRLSAGSRKERSYERIP